MKPKKSQMNLKKFICEYCGRIVAKKETLLRHYENCQQKMRHDIRSLEEVQIAYRLWNYVQYRKETIEKFEKSNLYKTFIDFVVNMSDKNCILIEEYGIWLLRNKISIYHWKKNTIYEQFIKVFINGEAPRDALLRSITNIEETGYYGRFFKEYPVGAILTMIEVGKVSPWVLVLNERYGEILINRLTGEKITYFNKLINIDRWKRKKLRYEKTCARLSTELEGIEI